MVVGPDHGAVAEEVKRLRPDAHDLHSARAPGHRAMLYSAAREAIVGGADEVLVVFGDTPLISAATFERLRAP